MKISRSLVSKIGMIAGFLVLSQLSFAGDDVVLRKDDDPSSPPTTPHAPFFIPVTASIDTNGLALDFIVSVGDATVTVYDESFNVVYQEIVDTNTNLSTLLPCDTWNNGSYTITIHYLSVNLVGNFTI